MIIVAGGRGKRMNSQIPKQFIPIAGLPVLMRSIVKFHDYDNATDIILVLPETEIDFWKNLCAQYHFNVQHTIVAGGNSRFQSVKNGLDSIHYDGLVAVHDGVRPFVSIATIRESFDVAAQKGNAIAAIVPKDSIRMANDKNESVALDRSKCYLIQTPQTFQIALLKKAFEIEEDESFTDDATVVEALGVKINLIGGTYQNIKITTPEDLVLAQAICGLT